MSFFICIFQRFCCVEDLKYYRLSAPKLFFVSISSLFLIISSGASHLRLRRGWRDSSWSLLLPKSRIWGLVYGFSSQPARQWDLSHTTTGKEPWQSLQGIFDWSCLQNEDEASGHLDLVPGDTGQRTSQKAQRQWCRAIALAQVAKRVMTCYPALEIWNQNHHPDAHVQHSPLYLLSCHVTTPWH